MMSLGLILSPFFFLFCLIGVHGSNSIPETHEEAFEHPHEEGDEHIVNRQVCSPQDLPEQTIQAYDRCTNFIPVYRKLNLLVRCREEVFPPLSDSNFMRKQLCFNHTAEHLFNECMNRIKHDEGREILGPNPLQTMDFMFCMKTIAIRRNKNPGVVACSVTASGSTGNTAVDQVGAQESN